VTTALPASASPEATAVRMYVLLFNKYCEQSIAGAVAVAEASLALAVG
jgi:hypothetical protein